MSAERIAELCGLLDLAWRACLRDNELGADELPFVRFIADEAADMPDEPGGLLAREYLALRDGKPWPPAADDDDGWCETCHGTGEGQHEGLSCNVCNGKGFHS